MALQKFTKPLHIASLTSFRPLSNKKFATFWTGALISSIGFWVQTVAQGWQVLQLTNSALLLGLVSFAVMLPNIILSPFGGVIADRFDRCQLLIFTQSVYMTAAATLAILTTLHVIAVWHIILLALLYGIFSSVNLPAWQAFPGDLLSSEDLNGGVALMAFQYNLARVTGPVTGGISIALFGIAGAYYFNALSYLAVIIPLLIMRSVQIQPKSNYQGMRRGLQDGLIYISRHQLLIVALLLQFTIAFLVFPYVTLLPIFARDIFHAGPTGLGVMNTAAGIGALFGSILLLLLSSHLMKKRYIYALSIVCIVGGFFSLIFAITRNFSFSLLLLLVLGLCTGASLTLTNSMVLKETPIEMRSRAVSIWVMLTMGLAPLGNLTTGWLAQVLSSSLALAIQGILCAFVGVIVIVIPIFLFHKSSKVNSD